MRFDLISIFPDMLSHAASFGVTGRAIDRGLVQMNAWNPRDYTLDKHRSVDDRPFGGGPGMVMKYQPLHDALAAIKNETPNLQSQIVCLSPQGRRIDQALLNQASEFEHLVLIAGRYEGIDERFIQTDVDAEWSLGDFVISGGELAALIVVDAITRLLPGVLGDQESAVNDSHMQGLLDCPHYTRPEKVAGIEVPEVLRSGNHALIAEWRLQQMLGRTWLRRPDMLNKLNLTVKQERLLEEFKRIVKI